MLLKGWLLLFFTQSLDLDRHLLRDEHTVYSFD